jgi:hypothetical protein
MEPQIQERINRRTPMQHYADRDIMNLEPQYSRHVSAMTREGLHGKAEIAAELAWRDRQIGLLKRAINDALMHLRTNWDIDGHSMEDSDAADTLRKAMSSNVKAQGTEP